MIGYHHKHTHACALRSLSLSLYLTHTHTYTHTHTHTHIPHTNTHYIYIYTRARAANEMAQRVLNTSNSNTNYSSPAYPAILLLAACNIVHLGSSAEDNMESLLAAMSEQEGNNAKIFYETGRLFCRLCGRNRNVLQYTVKMLKKACNLDPANSRHHSELAYQHRLAGNYGTALDTYRDAAKYDESNVDAIYGSIYCQIMQGR